MLKLYVLFNSSSVISVLYILDEALTANILNIVSKRPIYTNMGVHLRRNSQWIDFVSQWIDVVSQMHRCCVNQPGSLSHKVSFTVIISFMFLS